MKKDIKKYLVFSILLFSSFSNCSQTEKQGNAQAVANEQRMKSYKISDSFAKLNIEKGWNIGKLEDQKTMYSLDLPQKEGSQYLYDMILTGQCDLKDKKIRLLLEKTTLANNKFAWNIRRQLPNEETSYLDIGRIVTVEEKKLLEKISVSLGTNGAFSLGTPQAELQSFTPKPETENGPYTAESQKIATNKQPNSFEKTNILLLGEKLPAYFYGITLFAGLGFRDQLPNCDPTGLAKLIAAKYDNAICHYSGFAEEAVAKKKIALKQDLSPAKVTCQIDTATWSKNIGAKNKALNVFKVAKIPEGSAEAPTFSVPAATCDKKEIQDRACFHNTYIAGPNPIVYEYKTSLRGYRDSEDLPSSDCQESHISEIYCTKNEFKNMSNKTKQEAAKANDWVFQGVDARKATQELVCREHGLEPFFAICLDKKRLNVASPTACSIGSHVATCVPRIKGYEMSPYTVNVDNCADAQNACGEIATVKECR